MIRPFKLLKKPTLGALLTILVIGGFVVYGAYVDRTVYTTEQLVIIPGKVTSDSWLGLESVLVQDISEYSLYQDFTQKNSAYISELGLFSAQESEDAPTPDDPNEVSADDPTSTTSDDTTDNGAEQNNDGEQSDGDGGSGASTEPEATPVETPEPEPEPEPESTPEPEPASEPESVSTIGNQPDAVWGVFTNAESRYLLAQAIVTEDTAEPEPEPEVVVSEEPDTEETEVVDIEPTPEEVVENPVTEGTEETTPENSETTGSDTAETDSSSTETTEGQTESEPVPESEPVTEVDTTNDYVMAPCDPEAGCATHSMLFSDFLMPDFDGGTVLDSLQLRLSLAAQTKSNRGEGPQRFLIEYTYDTSTSAPAWITASVLDIDDEISNSINGGYYLLSLVAPPTPGAIANLRIKISYQGNVSDLETAYVEGMWLEVTSGKFFEEGTGDPYTDAVTYGRDLLAPELNTLDNAELDPALGTLPLFTLSYDPQQGFFNRIFRSLFSENTFVVESINLTDSNGEAIEVPFAIDYHDDTTWTMRAQAMPQKLRPGKYLVTVEILENEERYTDTFEFYWGVLAVNTKKSMYFPREDVTLNLAALTDKGDTICNANLELKIIDPKNNIFEVPVEQSGACGPNNVTDIPDYIAKFTETGEWGVYTIQLQHKNASGEVVHKISDSFEVRDYIPFDIERTAPTRIYPPAPYDVTLKVKAYRDFTGDINERVPRGFIIAGLEGAVISTLPEYTLITWKDVTMKEGDERTFSYNFDAPDISPYMYLLGPLDMDGFAELRQWQIASDALNNIGWFTGTRTVAGTNLNDVPSPMQWSTSSIDNYYFAHATSSNSERITLRQNGDYLVSVNLPQQRTDINVSRTRGAIEVRKNGVAVPEGLGRSGYITGGNGAVHSESSSNVSFLMTDVTANDYIEIFVENLNTIDAGDVINVSGQASLYLEYIRATETVFAATTTRTVASTDLNQVTPSALQWIETRQDTGFVHSNTITPQNITLTATGTYMVHINVPITGVGHTIQQNIAGRVLLDGAIVPGGHFQQGYFETAATESDGDASIHWSGVIVATTTNQVLTVTTARETTGAATTTVTPGFAGSIFIQKIPTTGVIALAGKTLLGGAGNNWNSATASSTRFTTQLAYDSSTFTHSTSTNNHQITVNASGDYILNYTDAVTSVTANVNNRITVTVGSTTVSGAQTKSNFIRNQNGHSDASTNLVFLLEGVTAGQIVTINTQQEAAAGTVSSTTDALIMLWKKATLDFRSPAPTMFATPFDNARMASTTPYFDFQSNDPDGSSDIQYEFIISTSSDFATATVRVSGTDTGFTNTASSTDTSPFIEGNRIRFQLQPGDALSDLTTYYWRVRARDVSGSGEFGDYSTTQSLSINAADTVPNWYQHLSGQFQSNTLIGAISAGSNNNVTVDAAVSTEILVGYGDGTSATPKYRLWNGTSWGTEFSAVAVGGTINWVKTAAAVGRDEYVMATIDQTSASYAQIYNATTSSWGNQTLLSGTVASNTTNGLAVGYESLSGDAIAVSCSNTKDPVFRIWNGSSWSATSSITVSLVGVCNYLEIASDPASDEMILVVRDSATQYQALVWNGSAWVANQVVGTGNAAQPGRSGIGLKYESSGDQAIIAVTNGSLSSIIYTTWNGTSFTTNTTQPIGDDFEFGSMASDPNSDNLALCYIDEDADIGVLRWNGGVWSTFFELDVNGNSQTARPLDCEFETVAGRSGNILFMYSDTVAARYQVFNYASSTWSTEASITGIGTAGLFWGQSERAGDGKIVSMWHDDVASGDEIESSFWNGTSWSTKQSIVPNPSSIIGVPFETYSMAAKRFQFTQGIVRSTPINFSSVPGQATWGDVSFETSEPFGTDVRVRVRYTATTTCDSYIPDVALVGNTAGFGTESIPVILTGLSTSTYSQICLEATITTLGTASASLNEWTVSWQRKPKLTQNNYRWYDNGSFLTPTDPWPFGVTDVAENTPLTSAESVNVNDVVRLRLALEGSNVTQATNTAAFKLQYSDGLSCTAATGWRDVGTVGSTTALWRGFANAIVGSDWYNSSWTRRSKITIEGTLVSGAQTDFPVYVNLDDLPDSFFANVQSDGDDIRVTTADGLTELPFELVSINTGAKTGELHFKATLASTTDTDFYIYYANAGASGYAPTATYGRNNVWTNGYEAVYHLGTSPASSMTDSTSNGRTLTMSGGMTAGNSTTSVLGNGVDFDGVNDQFTNAAWSWTANPVTVTAWNNVATAEVQNSNMFAFVANGNERFATHAPWGDNIIYWDYGTCCTLPGRVSTSYTAYRDKWTHVGLVSQGGAGAFMGIYLDGTAVATSSTSDDPNVTLTNFSLGAGAGVFLNGRLDEFRIASVARSGGWIATERTNQSNPTGFYAIAAEELIGDGALLPSKLLANSDNAESYEESNPTGNNRFAIPVGNASEWDFVLQNNAATANTNYCFRMVYADGSTLNSYSQYPQLITNAPPPAPNLTAPFDNEQLASTSPWFEFSADDAVSDEVSYEIMVDTDVNFGSPDITSESNANFGLFTNLASPSERGLYTSGQTIRFISGTPLVNGNTYWWRVRAKDDNGSGTYGEWSVPTSFTVNTATAITTWFQTTGDQFNTNNLVDAVASTSTNDVGIDTSFTNATMTSSGIDFDDRDLGNAWGAFAFTQNIAAGTIRYYIEYRTTGENYALVPDSLIPGNSSGLTASPVSLTALDTSIYNELRIVSVLSGTPSLPRVQSLTVTWAQTIDPPIMVTPFDNAKVATTSPALTFRAIDPQSDSLEYEIQYSSSFAFTASSTFNSGIDSGFVNTASSSDVTPFTSNEIVRYTLQTPLVNGNTYWWRVRARDPLGSNSWSNYSNPESFTVDTSILVSVWHQTTGEQFATNVNQDIETTAGGAQITSVVSGVMSAYGEGTGQAPQYRLWNGTTWSAAASADTVGAQIRWTQLKAAPTRPEYALATLGTDLDINIQIYDGISESWDDLFEIYTEATDAIKRRFDISYETTSGDLLAVACEGTEARYSVWNGTTWSATTSLNLANANNCEWVTLASDPVSDEIIAVFRHTNTANPDYEALVWNGSSFGNSTVFGNMNENAHEGIALNYEASGNQALAIVSNDTLGSFLWSAWNGSSWTTATATAIANDFEWGSLKRDVGTDNMVLCYIDDGADIGVKQWNGSSWSAGTVMTITGNDKRGLPADCEFQTLQGIDGDIVIPYSDATDAKYQTYAVATGTYSGEFTMIAGTNINDSWRLQTVRAGDGTIHAFAFDDGSNPDRYSTSRWDGIAWGALENFSTSPSITGLPFDGSITAAAQIYPNFTSGSVRSTAIDFADGSGPRWERLVWNDTTPAASDIRYRLYYQTTPGTFVLVPDAALAGNSAGFTTSPVSIAGLDRTVYSILKLDADLICDNGTCPTIQDWSLEWSQGINVSGTAYEYNGTTTVATGTVAVAVNGILQAGKTAVIGGLGTWTIPNVTAFTGDAITVFIDGAADADEAIGITTYDGIGDVTQMELSKRTVTFGSTDVATTTNSSFGAYDTSDDEDVFFSVAGTSTFSVCGAGACTDAKLKIKNTAIYQPTGNVTMFEFNNEGRFIPESNTIRVGGSWLNTGTFTPGLSTVIFTATTSTRTITSTSSASSTIYHNVTFGETSGTASWTLSKPLDITGTLAVDFGTLVRGTSTINLEQNLRIGVGGFVSGLGTTTFDGTGSHIWTDTSASSTNVGYVVIDGVAKTVTLGGNVAAQSVTIGADDTLNASGSGFNINVVNNWTNNNSFIPQSGTVTFVGTTTGTIARGTSAFNNLTFSGIGGNWSFSTSTLAVNNNLTIATGTVTLPTGTTTVGGNFNNSGGTFLHNNGEVRMTSATAGKTITQRATAFLNAFYDLTFAGAGGWSYTESAATTTRNYNIQSGTVTLASSTLTVGGNFNVTGSGAFAHNNGEVILLVQDSNTVRTNGSSFNNLRTRGVAATSWYSTSWSARQPIVINNTQVPTTVTDFPVYVNLANLPDAFFSTVNASGTDIRVTTGDGITEVPHEVVSINTGAKTGELHFKALSVSSTTNTTFYIYYGNSGASAYASSSAFGSNNVWTNGYEAVYHLQTNPAQAMVDSTRNSRNLTSVGGMGAGNSVAGAVGNAIDFDGVNDYLTNAGFAWPNASNTVTVTAWNNVSTAETKAANLFGFTESGGQRFATHGPWSDAVLYWDFGLAVVPGRVQTSYASYRDKWTHVGLTSPGAGGGNMNIYLDGAFIAGSTASDPNVTLTGFSLGSLGASQYHDGRIDEFRIASVVRTAGWIATERNNQASSTAFYSVSAPQNRTVRTFTDTNATILGNYILDIGGDSTFPTGVLSIGGSFDNNAVFTNSSGTVRFNSTSGSETIAMGTSSNFATLEFNSATGDFTVIENATATIAINLTSASAFTVQSGLTLATLGTFTNAAVPANTTWTGSTLSLSGPDGAINLKSHAGDAYGTILTNGDTDMTMWNSTAATYSTASTSSIYSSDHAGVDGDLNIYGDYVRTTGTEFWSYGTDFDGAALTGTTSRQVDVRIATSSRVGFVSASLNMVGGIATTTLDAISGAYTLSATNTTITASNFTVAGTNVGGLQLNASTTLATFTDGFFTVVPGRTGITISSSTVAHNPSAQYQRIGFATTTAGAGTNVTLTGTTSAFVWFRNGTGNLYGENFDAGDGNPGSVRWDDSSNSIVVSGVVYADDGITPLGSGACNGSALNVRIVVNSGTYSSSTSCAAGTGAYSFPAVNFVGDPTIIVYLDTNTATSTKGSVVTKTPTGNITNMHIYAGRVITRHQDVAPLTIANMVNFQNSDDSDIQFIATSTGSTSLQVLAPNSLFVFATTTFAPGGNVTLLGNASSSAVEGTLQLGAAATFTASGTETHTLAGRLVLATTSTLTSASSTFIFNASTTGKSITSPNTIVFNTIQFTGVGGGWNITAPLTVNGNMNVATGTVTGTSNVTLTNGSLSGDGTLSFGSGTTTINRTNTLGGTRAWTFANLVLGNGLTVGTTTRSGTATTTVSGRLTISPAHFLVTGSSGWDLSGTGTVFVESGTLNEDTSTFRYSGAGSNVLSTTYYNLDINAGAGTPTYTATGVGIGVTNNLTIGGTAATVFDGNTSDPALVVGGSVTIRNNGTFSASNIATTSIGSSFTNLGTFQSNGGLVAMVGSGSSIIAPGTGSFGSLLINNGAGTFTVSQNATTTVALTLLNHANFTQASGTTMNIGGTFTNTLGGGATTFASSTLNFYGGGTKTINAKTVNDVYHALTVATGTNVKMWNSSATNYNAAGSIYSQDHNGVDGQLNIYGAYTQTTGNDYWSYATDFDGTALGGSPRKVDVLMASGSATTYSGGGLEVMGTSTASTTITNQGTGTFGLTISGTASTTWDTVLIRNTNASGTVFTGTPTVNNFSRTDHLISVNNGTGITVSGTVIDANQAKNFTNNVFASTTGGTNARNVTATGTTISSWRFTNHTGALSGEAYDNDPTGDPGYIVWDDSAALITVSGNVYSDEGVTVSPVCDGVTQNILLRVAGLTTYTTSCNAGTGAYSIPSVAFSPADTLTVYIDNNIRKAVTVSADPVSSISNMHLYENRVIVRHENTSPLSIADMAVWDSSDDGDILFTAVDAGTDTLSLPADQKLLIWNGKTFEPAGNVTVAGGGGGGAQDGTLEAQTNAIFRALGTETHTIGGSMIFGTGATFTAGQSTTTFTTTGAGRTIDVNSNPFHNVAFTGAGSFNVTDTTFTTNRSFTQTNGTVTFGSGTTTIGASFNATGGSFTMGGAALVFTSTSTGNTVRFDDSLVPSVLFRGTGGVWSMADTNATTTGSFTVASGTVTLPSGNLGVAGSFENIAGTIVHNTSDIIMSATSSALVRASSSNLFAVRFVGVGPFTLADVNLTLADSLTMSTGTLTMATGTVSVGGDFVIASGTVNNATGTVLLNATAVGKTVNFGNNALYNVVFGSGTGGWTFAGNATTTNNFSITGASNFTKSPNTTLSVGGVFTNTVGGSNTTWATTTLRLYGTNGYTLNTKTTGGDVYGTLEIASPLAIRAWNSSAATTTVLGSASLYSQDHAAVDGALNIYGAFGIATTTEYWNYSNDFDGTVLAGAAQRQVNLRLATNATTTLTSGTLQILGTAATSTTVAALSSGSFGIVVTGGTLNAQYYSIANMGARGLDLSGVPTITNLANGYYNLTTSGGSLITVDASVLDANASKIFAGVGFATTSAITGNNVTLTGSTSNAWRFSGSYGNLGGEAFDVDGITACGSIRFDNSGCLLTQQTHYRFRNDDGGEGAPNSEWFNSSFDFRQRVRVVNTDTTSYASTAVKIAVTYDSSMQSDFDDLRFTSGDGLTTIPHWIERFTASTDAVVWVRVPNLPASEIATVFMYYGSSTAVTASNGAVTFDAFDDFEDNNISEYSGDTSLFQTDTAPVYGGTYALEAFNKSGRTTDGIFRTAMTVSQGQIIRWMQYLDSAGTGDDACTLFGVQSPGTNNNNYAICLEKFGVDRLVIAENVADNDSSGTVLASSTATFATGWYEVEVDWRTNNSIQAFVRTAAGALIATASTTDNSYTTGGVGFTFWFQNGSWDSYTARPRAILTPTVHFGAEQTDGGATWERAQNVAGSGVTGVNKRLRFAIENSGLDITNQTFRLEYALKGAAPSCEAVVNASYAAVPNQASCGSSPICMQTSTQLADNDPSTDLLASTTGAFTAGRVVESPSNITSSLNINQNRYTELEYVLTPTINATSSYCLRVTNGGTPLDFYNKVAEMNLQFDPVFGPVSLNNGQDIALIPGTTTTIFATGTVTDFNGAADITAASSTIYRLGAGAGCSANTNNCYKADNTASSSCTIGSCAGNTCTLSCRADIFFNADATDASSTFSGETWEAFLEVRDASGNYDFANAISVELYTLRAASVNNAINYGSLGLGDNTAGFNPTTTVTNVGNVKFNIQLLGSDLSDGGSSNIPAERQKFATSTFTYGACVSCGIISSTTPTLLAIDLAKPTAPTPPVSSAVYWGIEVPAVGINSAPHSGINVFTPVFAP